MARYARVKGSIALITLTNPPVNALSAAVRRGIVESVSRALKDEQVKAVVFCGENEKFCGGADIKEFSGSMSGPPLVPMIHSIEAGEKLMVAAIEGVALGGGLELALGCHYRRHVSAQEALQLGIVDQVAEGSAVQAAMELALSVIGQPLNPRRLSLRAPVWAPDVDGVCDTALAQVKQRSRGAMAPVACVQAVRAAAMLPYSKGMERERQLMDTLFRSGQARAMQYAFFAQRNAGKWSLPNGAQWNNTRARDVQRAGVIGLGTMGRGITVCLVKAGISVVAIETDAKQLESGKKAVTAMLQRDAKRRGVSPPLHLLTFTLSFHQLRDVDLVIEAVFEDMNLKKRVFSDLCKVLRANTLICTNTSGLSVDELAAVTDRQPLVVGMHFFAPAHVMKLLEVVSGSRSSPEAVATAMALGKRIEKVCVAVGNCSGFVGNRMLKLYLDQSVYMLEEGATPEQVDQALEEFGFAMGIFKVSDLSGLDVGWRVRKASGLIGPDVDPVKPSRWRLGRRYCPLPDMLCQQGRFGQKTGRGWYLYDSPGSKEAKSDPEIQTFLKDYRHKYGIIPRRITSQEVIERCAFSLANEGFRILEDRIAASPEDIDVIYLFGYGWPRHRGGPMFYAAQVGLSVVLEKLEHYHRVHPDVPSLEPSRLLRRLVAEGSPPIQQWKSHIKNLRSHL
ncbi:hypothetical protein PDJAM_G00217580 [Pangasius djambal]|uniref:Uncharacterized protein n=1 Tax=Pangasius djambal TaxID=1691987 RepID=A0ACC5YC58_9TELE|nr:hypothetical protein [Pangasius djambal]